MQEIWTFPSYQEAVARLRQQLKAEEDSGEESSREGFLAVRAAFDAICAEEKEGIPYPPVFLRFLDAFPSGDVRPYRSLIDAADTLQADTAAHRGLREACGSAMR